MYLMPNLYKCHQCPKTRFDLESDLINHYKMHEGRMGILLSFVFEVPTYTLPKPKSGLKDSRKKRCTKCDATFADAMPFTSTYGNVVLPLTAKERLERQSPPV
ncbi:hypothetical protein CEXT_425391 [Caerostris extrusa]|uniref:C2H2-type domain-containing protein n=1 Tax=Caerostris extrusa TaxID=172846 RepID=A0AAV4UYM4_CAEEX|nr:hypothetical protein CEXT_425391 [Caerostris extrusa]